MCLLEQANQEKPSNKNEGTLQITDNLDNRIELYSSDHLHFSLTVKYFQKRYERTMIRRKECYIMKHNDLRLHIIALESGTSKLNAHPFFHFLGNGLYSNIYRDFENPKKPKKG
jgi:hypothetical protein